MFVPTPASPVRAAARRAVIAAFSLLLCAAVSLAADKVTPTFPFPNKPTEPLTAVTGQLIDAETLAKHQKGTLLLLHINDVHDILKAPVKGLGGLAYVAGYAKQMRARRPDTLFVDAGDILQKGDRMSVVSQGEAGYRALGALGLDCSVPGNHDFCYGFEVFLKNIKLPGLNVLCAGMVYGDTRESVLPETMIKQIGPLRVGLIGATINRPVKNPRPVVKLDNPDLGKRIDELARKMEPNVDLTVLVLHNGMWAGKTMASAAPLIDLVVCGHTNEVTQTPLKAESGALVVEVGRAGMWVGQMDLVVDRDQKKIGKYTYELVPMDHAKIQPDAPIAKLIEEMDRKWCPENYVPKEEAASTTAAKGANSGKE